MTTASSPPPPSTSQTTSASSNVEYDTAAAAAATTEAPPQQPSTTPDPQDYCVLCAYPLPLHPNESIYKSCCGHVICMGYILGQQRVRVIGTNVTFPLKGSKEEEREFRIIGRSKPRFLCPFCNAKETYADDLKRLHTRINKYKDPQAMDVLGVDYATGKNGLPKDLIKAEELLKRSYDLGHSHAAFNLYQLHLSKHVPDEVLMRHYLEEGARRGYLACMSALADMAVQSGNHEEAIRQYMTAARSGYDEAMQNLMTYYRPPFSAISKDDLATTLRAHKAANDTRTSVPREYRKRYCDFIQKINAREGN